MEDIDDTATIAAAALSADVVVSIEATNVTTISKLEAALRAVVQEAKASGKFLP